MKPGGQGGLFAQAADKQQQRDAPLAERLRPARVEDIVGQDTAIGETTFLGRMLRGTTPPRSCVLWGPPGTGKTTIARLIAERSDHELAAFSAVLSGVKDLRELLGQARVRREMESRGTVLFVDEIHRFNKAQQDAFLPHVESGAITLVGATTENPSFEIIAPLLSRCRVVVLQPLSAEAVGLLLDRALDDPELGLGGKAVSLEPKARAFLAEQAGGDARIALGALEAAADLAVAEGATQINLATAEQGLQRKALLYDRGGDEHYNVISAFIKSMRASDVDAAVYWLARMLEAGEDPMFIARRMVVFASEDVGLADPGALPLAVAARDAVAFVGLPEARINLGHAVAYLAATPKSNTAYLAIDAALAEVRNSGALAVPLHLRNAPTKLMKDLNYGSDYIYPHGREEEASTQTQLPDALAGTRFYQPGPHDRGGPKR